MRFLLGVLLGLLVAFPGAAYATHEEASLSLHHQNPQNLVARSTTPGLTSLYIVPNGPIGVGIPAQMVVVDRDISNGVTRWREMVNTIGQGEYLTAVQAVGGESEPVDPWRFRYGATSPFLTVTQTERLWDGGLSVNHSQNSAANALWITNRHENATSVGIVAGVGEGLDYRFIDVKRTDTNTSVVIAALRHGGEFPTLELDGVKEEVFIRGQVRMQALTTLPVCNTDRAGTLVFFAPDLLFCDGETWRTL